MLTKFVKIIFAFSLIILIGCQSDFDKGEKAFKQKDYDNAVKYYSNVDSTGKHYDLALKRLNAIDLIEGEKALALKKFAEAKDWFLKIQSNDPNYNLASEKLIEIYRHFDSTTVNEAKLLIKKGNFEEAINKLDTIIPRPYPIYKTSDSLKQIALWNYAHLLLKENKLEKVLSFIGKLKFPYHDKKINNELVSIRFNYFQKLSDEKDWQAILNFYHNIKFPVLTNNELEIIKEAKSKLAYADSIASSLTSIDYSAIGIWTCTDVYPGAIWMKYIINSDKTYDEYAAMPTDKNWNYLGKGQWETGINKYEDTGENYNYIRFERDGNTTIGILLNGEVIRFSGMEPDGSDLIMRKGDSNPFN